MHKHSPDRTLLRNQHGIRGYLASVQVQWKEGEPLLRQRKHRAKITLLGLRLCVKIKRSIKGKKDRVCGLNSSD